MFAEAAAVFLLLNPAGPLTYFATSPAQDSSAVFSATKPRTLDEATRPELSGALSRLETDGRIRVELLSRDRLEGQFFRVSDSTLFVVVEQERETYTLRIRRAIPADSVQSVWKGNDLGGTGAVIGGAVGIALGLIWASHSAEDAECEGEGLEGVADCIGAQMGTTVGVVFLGVILGLAVGCLTGLAIGSAISHWSLIYP